MTNSTAPRLTDTQRARLTVWSDDVARRWFGQIDKALIDKGFLTYAGPTHRDYRINDRGWAALGMSDTEPLDTPEYHAVMDAVDRLAVPAAPEPFEPGQRVLITGVDTTPLNRLATAVGTYGTVCDVVPVHPSEVVVRPDARGPYGGDPRMVLGPWHLPAQHLTLSAFQPGVYPVAPAEHDVHLDAHPVTDPLAIRRIRELLVWLEAHPEELDQRTYYPWGWNQRETHPCGTACCAAGNTILLTGHTFSTYGRQAITFEGTVLGHAHDEARRILGMTRLQANCFFCSENTITDMWDLAECMTDGAVTRS